MHGSTSQATGSITFDYYKDNYNYDDIDEIETDYVLMDNEELEKYMKERENIYETNN